MSRIKAFFTLVVVCVVLNGCNNDILDPTQIGRFEPTPSVNVILDSLGVADEPTPTYEGAEEPKPEDLIDAETDYVFGSGDVVRISIFELYQQGQTYVNDYVVTETGRVSIPDVGQVQAAGLTEAQLEQEIRDILSPSVLKNPSVTVILLSSQSQFFSIVGQGVGQSSRFQVPRYPFKLTDAISLAGGVAEFNVTYIYVSRDVPETQVAAYPAQSSAEPNHVQAKPEIKLTPVEPKGLSPEDEMLNIIAPSVAKKQGGLLFTTAEMASRSELESLAAPEGIDLVEGVPTEPVSKQEVMPATEPQSEQVQWVFEDGKWKPTRAGGQVQETPSPTLPVSQQQLDKPTQQPDQETGRQSSLEALGSNSKVTRVLRIPVDRLLAGDPRYNIIIRPGDRITVPVDLIGEFWVMGNLRSQGAIPITGRPITLKMAVASAGGLNDLAVPQKVEVVRRIGKNKAGMMQEQTVMVDLAKIAKGEQPDFFIKPYDLINVGTTGTARWMYQLRNAFRPNYGFSFTYDRNFADLDAGGNPFPGHLSFDSIF
jgi:protein involved in polysaccharide export with SLBB domain